jgi:hypothetical protein
MLRVENLQVTALASRAAVALGGGKVTQTRRPALDLALVVADDNAGLFFGAGNLRLAPRRSAARVPVLDQQVGASDLAFKALLVSRAIAAELGSMVLSHVVLEALTVSALWRLPS